MRGTFSAIVLGMNQPSRPHPEAPAHCTFCNLIQGAAEVSVCHEDSDAIAFMDIQPVNNGHVLSCRACTTSRCSTYPRRSGCISSG